MVVTSTRAKQYRLSLDGIGFTQGRGDTSCTRRFVFLELHLAIDTTRSNQKLADSATLAIDSNALCLLCI